MSDSAAQLKREGTMAVTAQEGKEFLEAQGMTVTDDDVKTRAQKETLDQITSETNGDTNNTEQETANGDGQPADEASEKPKLARDSTMAVTANEGAQILDGEELEKTRGQTAAAAAAKEDEGDESDAAKLKRTTTMAQTTEDSQHILGNEEYGKTRSQTRKFSESEEKKPAVKRTSTMAQTAKEGEEFLARENKRAKGEEDGAEEEGGEEEQKEVAAED